MGVRQHELDSPTRDGCGLGPVFPTLPVGIVFVNRHEGLDGITLPSEEARCLRHSVSEMRRQEFAAGRACAREALRLLGAPADAVRVGLSGEPMWPVGVVGSITHTGDVCAAAVAWASDYRGVGVDTELLGAVPERLASYVATATERAGVAVTGGEPIEWATTIFCAKESVFKACFPLTRVWMDFHDVAIDVDVSGSRFAVRFVGSPSVGSASAAASACEGYFAISAGHVLTLVTIR